MSPIVFQSVWVAASLSLVIGLCIGVLIGARMRKAYES